LQKIKFMEVKYFSLGPSENSSILKIIRILFGAVCIGIAIFWMIFSIRSEKSDRTLWVTVLFLSGFGLYQVWAGLGRALRFIQIFSDKVILRKNSFLPMKVMTASQIKKIEVFPLNLVFYFKEGGKTILRFGTTFTDSIEPVKSGLEEFAALNNIDFEIITEVL
jgi:hypothetical protein